MELWKLTGARKRLRYLGLKRNPSTNILPYSLHNKQSQCCVMTQYGQYLFLNNQPDTLIIQIYSVIKFYMFQASSLPIIRSFLLYIQHW